MQISENIKVSTGNSALCVDQRDALQLNDENLKATSSGMRFRGLSKIHYIGFIRPLAGYGLPPPHGEFCRSYFS